MFSKMMDFLSGKKMVPGVELQPEVNFAFCETVVASSRSPWHIRQLTARGKKLSGGADSLALCGRRVAWDLNVRIDDHHLSHACPKCAQAYRALQ